MSGVNHLPILLMQYKEQNPMTQQFNTFKDAFHWCIDHPGQRCRDEQGREIWFQNQYEEIAIFQTNIDFSGGASTCQNALTPEELAWLDLATLRPVEAEPEKPTLANLAALENWDWYKVIFPNGLADLNYKDDDGWRADYYFLQTALSAGWPVEFGRSEA